LRDSEFQELVRRHPEVKSLFERVSGSYRAKPHWRVKAKWKLDRKARSEALLKVQVSVAETAYANFGKKGFDEEGKPIVASNIGKVLRGKVFKKPKVPEWQKVYEKIREITV
jgi:hypothetical protein